MPCLMQCRLVPLFGATWADCWMSGKKGWGDRRLMAVALAMSGCYSTGIAFICFYRLVPRFWTLLGAVCG